MILKNIYKKLINKTSFIQITIALIVSILIITYLLSLDVHNELNSTVILPILLMSGIAVGVCFIIGLPIRLSKQLNNWWIRHIYVQVIIFILGFAFLLISLVNDIAERCRCGGINPNITLMIIGLILVIFILLHFYFINKSKTKREMNQKEFSKYVLDGMLKQFPQFINHFKIENDTMTIEYHSKSGMLTLWITTQDNEITIGFDNIEGNCYWHTHMSQYNSYESEDELREAIKLINNIMTGNEIIVFINNIANHLTKNTDINAIENRGNVVELKRWNEL